MPSSTFVFTKNRAQFKNLENRTFNSADFTAPSERQCFREATPLGVGPPPRLCAEWSPSTCPRAACPLLHLSTPWNSARLCPAPASPRPVAGLAITPPQSTQRRAIASPCLHRPAQP